MLTRALGLFFANLMPFVIMVQAMAALIFMQNIAIQFNIQQNELMSQLKDTIGNSTQFQDAVKYYDENKDEAAQLYNEKKEDAKVALEEAKVKATEQFNQTKVAALEKYEQMKAINFDDVQTNMMIVPYVVCAIGIICLATPMRKKFRECWDKCFGDDKEEDQGVTYKSKALQFTDDYDTTNPLTQKEGKIRLLKTQIASLEDQGEDGKEQAEMLRNQLKYVESTDNRSAMQNFVQ